MQPSASPSRHHLRLSPARLTSRFPCPIRVPGARLGWGIRGWGFWEAGAVTRVLLVRPGVLQSPGHPLGGTAKVRAGGQSAGGSSVRRGVHSRHSGREGAPRLWRRTRSYLEAVVCSATLCCIASFSLPRARAHERDWASKYTRAHVRSTSRGARLQKCVRRCMWVQARVCVRAWHRDNTWPLSRLRYARLGRPPSGPPCPSADRRRPVRQPQRVRGHARHQTRARTR